VCYFGEGAASEGDFHAALNFASTKECPVLFFCRNNGFAISTPVLDQFRGDGIASRGAGYGIPVMRVDGNDFLAVHVATREARKFILEHKRPVLIEAMSYRQGHHSTSDDSTRYREVAEIKHWKEANDPIDRTKEYLMSRGWISEEQDQHLRDNERTNVLAALQKAELKGSPPLTMLFEDVYDTKTPHLLVRIPLLPHTMCELLSLHHFDALRTYHLQEQERDMLEHIAKYPDYYADEN
jgi:2-oxoisovalerate dehydrogenase E1 component alpha subunit